MSNRGQKRKGAQDVTSPGVREVREVEAPESRLKL